jgi:YgiT-type zinc finger domain-containing protein
MKCAVCGGELMMATTDLPFKVSDTSIVILKGLPVIQCAKCPEYLMEDEVLRRVDEILSKVEGGTGLEIVRYAA